MKEVIIEKCRFCGGEEFIEGRVGAYGGVYIGAGPAGIHTAALFAIVCRDCGSVVRTFCKTPEKLYPKKDRRE